MANQTTYMLSLDDNPIQSVNASFSAMADDLAMVNYGLVKLANELTFQVIPFFKGIGDSLITSNKNIEYSNSAFQSNLNSAFSRFISFQSSSAFGQDATNDPNSFHYFVNKAHDVTDILNNSFNLIDSISGKGVSQEYNELEKGVSFADETLGILNDFPGFTGDEMMSGLGESFGAAFSEVSVPAMIIGALGYGLYNLFTSSSSEPTTDVQSTPIQGSGNTMPPFSAKNKQEFAGMEQSALAEIRKSGYSDGADYLSQVDPSFKKQFDDAEKYFYSHLKFISPTTLGNDNNSRYAFIDPSIGGDNDAINSPQKFTYYNNRNAGITLGGDNGINSYQKFNYGETSDKHGSKTGLDNVNTTPPYSGFNVINITNHYNNLIGQFTINSTNLEMDLKQVKMLVAETLMDSVKDFQIK